MPVTGYVHGRDRLAALQARGAGLQLPHWHAGTPFDWTTVLLLPHPAATHFSAHLVANPTLSKSHAGKVRRLGAQVLHAPSWAYLVGHHWHISPPQTPSHTQSHFFVVALKVLVPRPEHFDALQTLGVGDGVGGRVGIVGRGGRVKGGNVGRGGAVKSDGRGGFVKSEGLGGFVKPPGGSVKSDGRGGFVKSPLLPAGFVKRGWALAERMHITRSEEHTSELQSPQ